MFIKFIDEKNKVIKLKSSNNDYLDGEDKNNDEKYYVEQKKNINIF
jgi:hypothetical protein